MNCPACGGASTKVTGASGAYTLHFCLNCGVEFWTPLEHPGEKFYETSDLHSIQGERDLQWRHRFFLDNSLPAGDILDVGCGPGEFLAECRKKGFCVWGVDIAERNIQEAKRRYAITTITRGTLRDFIVAHPEKKFDIISFFEIIEHLHDPVAFFEDIKRVLKPGGRIVMSVPNVDRFGGPAEKEETPPNHLFRWRERALRQFLSRMGFKDIQIALQPVSSEFFLVRGWFSFGIIKKIASSQVQQSSVSGGGNNSAIYKALRFAAAVKNKAAYPLAAIMALPLRLLGKKYWDMYATALFGDGAHKEIHEGHKKRYEFAEPYVKGKRTLDAACGFGIGSTILAQSAATVTGIDLSDEELPYAQKHFEGGNLIFAQGDITRMPFPDNAFDAAVSFETIEHLDAADQTAFLKELQRVVAAGGTILLSTPDHYVWQRLGLHWDEHINELTKKELIDLLNGFFTVKNIGAQWLLKKESLHRRFVRGMLNCMKRLDIFGLRYRLISKEIRQNIDRVTTPVAMGQWDIMPIHGEETGAHIIALCVNDKKTS